VGNGTVTPSPWRGRVLLPKRAPRARHLMDRPKGDQSCHVELLSRLLHPSSLALDALQPFSTDAFAYRRGGGGRAGVHHAGVYDGGVYRGGAYRGVAVRRGVAVGVGAAAAGAAAYGAYGAHRCGYYPYPACY
jgi:hypothetical protein